MTTYKEARDAFENGRMEAIHPMRFCGRDLILPWEGVCREQFIRGYLMYGGSQAEVDKARKRPPI